MSKLNNKKINTENVFINDQHYTEMLLKGSDVETDSWKILGKVKLDYDSRATIEMDTFYPAGNVLRIESIEPGDALDSVGTIDDGEDGTVGKIFNRALFEKKRWYLITVSWQPPHSSPKVFRNLFQLEADWGAGKRICYPLKTRRDTGVDFDYTAAIVAEPRDVNGFNSSLKLTDAKYIGFYCHIYMFNTSTVRGTISSMTIQPLPLYLDIDGYGSLHNVS